jgi:transcriptional regulator with XRE-family HTH domain
MTHKLFLIGYYAVQNPYKHISLTLKALRQERGWSLDKTAEETGVSKAMLGQIERQESSPTIATLWKIASGFQTSFSSFLEDTHEDLKKPIYRSGSVQNLSPTDDKIRVMPLFPFDEQLRCEIFIIELLPTCEHLSAPHKPGVIEHVIVVDGTIEVLLQNNWKVLHKGEGLCFNANQPHGYKNTTKKNACFHNIIHYPILKR